MKLKVKLIFPISILFLLVWYTYGGLTLSFYQQEEWLGLGNTFVYGRDYLFLNTSNLTQMFLMQGRYLNLIINYFFYTNFPFNPAPIIVFGIFLHTINSILVLLLTRKLIKNSAAALLGASFFAVNAVSQGAVSWSAAIGTLPATTAILIALFVFFSFLEKEKGFMTKLLLLAILVSLYVSLLFKQIGIYLFVFLPVMAVIYRKIFEGKSVTNKIIPKIYAISGFIFLSISLYWVFWYKSILGKNALFLTGSNEHFFEILLLRFILYPLTSFSLLYIPAEQFLEFSRYITNLYYPFFHEEQYLLIAQTVVLDLLAVLLTIIIFSILYIFGKKALPQDRFVLIFFVGFILLSYSPYILISKSYAYLESRYYYLGAVGGSVIFAWLVAQIVGSKKFINALIFSLAIVYILMNGFIVKSDVEKQVKLSEERRAFLSQLDNIKPNLNEEQNIFYITGNQDFYVIGNKVPFQQGMGHTLLVWYFKRGNIPEELMKSKELFEIGSQGYFEYHGKGFGYFSDKEDLKQALIDKKIANYSIIYLYYDANSKKLLNKTSELSEQL